MKTISMFIIVLVSVITPIMAKDSEPRDRAEREYRGDGEKASSKAVVTAARMGAGAMIGGRIGSVVAGGPVGAAIGVIITPSETAPKELDMYDHTRPERAPQSDRSEKAERPIKEKEPRDRGSRQ